MNGQPDSQEAVAAGPKSRYRLAVLPVGLTIVICLVAAIVVRPRVGPWLEVRSAYWNLSSADNDARTAAIRRLRRLGEETESKLISLMHHADSGVRHFAASELAHRAPVTSNILEAFLVALENNQHVAEIGPSAPRLFFRHAENSSGPPTKTDQRIIVWLKTELNSTDPDRSGTAAWALTAFVSDDPSLRKPLIAYLKNGPFFYKYIVLRVMVDHDASLRAEYVDLLLSGLRSPVFANHSNALYGLVNMKNEPDDLRSRLKARREESTDSGEIARIDEALEKLGSNEAAP